MKPGFYEFWFHDGRRDVVRVVTDSIAAGTMETPESTVAEYARLGRFGALIMPLGKTEGGPADKAVPREIPVIYSRYKTADEARGAAEWFARYLGNAWSGKTYESAPEGGWLVQARHTSGLAVTLGRNGTFRAEIADTVGFYTTGYGPSPVEALAALEHKLMGLRDGYEQRRGDVAAVRNAFPRFHLPVALRFAVREDE